MKYSLRSAARLAALAAFAMFASGVASGCGDSNKSDSPAPLPSRGDDAGGQAATDSGSSDPSCTSVTLQVSDTPACDTCAKDKCCTEVLACDKSADCKGLQVCLAKCASTDLQCLLTCQAAHDKGAGLLQELGACAQLGCAVECPDQTPDADLFGDAF